MAKNCEVRSSWEEEYEKDPCPEGKDAYPISTFTWLLIPSKIQDQAKKKAIKDFLQWMLTDRQNMVEALSYAKLPKEVVAMEQKAISAIE